MSQTLSRTGAMLASVIAIFAASSVLAADSGSADTAPDAPRPQVVLTSAAPAATGPVAVTATAATAATAAAAPADGGWTPLGSEPFGQELFAKWVPVPSGESGAPRQGWLGTADGFFTREVHLAYTYTDSIGPDAHQVLARFHLPLSRRLWTGVEVPFYQESGARSGFGDITLNTQLMLVEKRNISLNAGVGWRLPTGASRLGNGVSAAQPQLNLFTDIGGGFSFRGRVAYDFPDSARPESFILNAAIGQTVTGHEKAPVGDLTWYVASTYRAFANGPDFVSVTPGVRTHLGNNLFLLAGIEIPLTDARRSFREGFTVQLVKGF